MIKLLKQKWVFRLAVLTPIFYLTYNLITGGINNANPLETILFYFGNVAVFLLLITLWISPLQAILPPKIPIRIFNIHKRIFGVSSFFYALLHFSVYFIDAGSVENFFSGFQRNFVIIGSVALSVLFLLAATSFDWVIKKMRKKNWKKFHRLVYLVIILLFFHITAKDKGNYQRALVYFLPLVLAEMVRFYLFIRQKRNLFVQQKKNE